MSISSVDHRTRRANNYALATAASIIDRSGIVDLLQTEVTAKSTRGRKATLPQYALRPVLIVQQYLFIRGLHQSWANVLFAIWFDIPDAQLASIGFPPGWRKPARRAELVKSRPRAHFEPFPDQGSTAGTSAPGQGVVPSATHPSPHLNAAGRLSRQSDLNSPWDNEYKRLWKFINAAMAPIDDTVASANSKQPARTVRAAQADASGDAARALRLRCINAIIRGANEHANAAYYPHVSAHRLHEGLLRHHTGDLAVDEHLFAVGLSKNARFTFNNVKQLAARSAHLRREEKGDAIGITVATTAFRSGSRRVPTIAMGIDVHPAVTGAPRGARNAIAAIEAQDMRPPLAGRAHQYVTADKAYPHYVGFTAFLIEHGYTLHAKLGERQRQVFDLAPEDSSRTSGPYLKGGCVLCPGVGAQFLQDNIDFDVPDEKRLTAAQLRKHQPIERQINATLMPTNGRPQRAKAAAPGRPRADAPAPPDLLRVSVRCPALKAKVRCPIIKNSMTLPPDTPLIHHPPHPERWPEVCELGSQVVTLNTEQAKTYLGSGMVDGTWAHQDLYGPVRSRNEAYFNKLMDPNMGNLRLGAIDFDKNGPVALAIAMAIAATNLQIIDKHHEQHGPNPPPGDATERRNRRAKIMNGQIRHRRNRSGRN